MEPEQQRSLSGYTAPKYWPTWIGIWAIRLVAALPLPLQMAMGKTLGLISYRLARKRRKICEINLELCFPDLDKEQRARMVRDTFIANGIGLIEAAMSWCSNPERYRAIVKVEGLENLQKAAAKGKGVLLVGAHYSTLEMGGVALSLFHPMDTTYRAHKNPLFDAFQFNGRNRHYTAVIERENVRGALRNLKSGHVVWYAPDQDYGPRRAVFVPFFGNPAATITATSRFAAYNDSPVIFISHYRNADNSGYYVNLSEELTGYPSGDDEADAKKITGLIEQAILKQPDQYLWLHKRFKTQQDGPEASPYKDI